MQPHPQTEPVQALRRFNRLYTQRIRLLEPYLGSTFTLTQARVLYEIATRRTATAAEIAADLGLDVGYLSRLLSGFQRQGLLQRKESTKDRRSKVLSLTPAGRSAYRRLKRASERDMADVLHGLGHDQQRSLLNGMQLIEGALGAEPSSTAPTFTLRAPRTGDIAWTAYRQAVLYAEELGWDEGVEPLVLDLSARFVKDFDPAGDDCWIADRGGNVVGAVFLVRESPRVGRLRMLYVEPSARGLGVGGALVEACVARARELGYRRLTLWTNDVLASARRLYEAAGFRLTRERPHDMFGRGLVGQDWDLNL